MAKSFDQLVEHTTTTSPRRRAAKRTHEMLQKPLLREIRQLRGKSHREIAAAIAIKQPSLSKLEKQSDMQISTLSRIIAALGGELEVRAKFPSGSVTLGQFRNTLAARRTARRTAS